MKATYVQRGEYIDHVPAADVHAGDVIVQGKLAGITKLDIKAGELGAIATTGVFDIVKDAGEIPVGAIVHWNGEKATAAADNGGTGADKVEYAAIGKAVAPAAASDASVRVLLNG